MTNTPPPGSSTSDDNKARAFFAICLTIGAGFAGLAVAGLILGADYLLHGEPHERERLAQQRADRARDRYADALAWLDNDRHERERARKAKRDWFAADPDTRGNTPTSGETVGKALARAWNSLLVGQCRFKRGWQKGRDEARQRRANGDRRWWRRPEQAQADPADPAPGGATPDPRQPAPTPPTAPVSAAGPRPGQPDIVDAEIVPDGPATRDVVPVGEDDPAQPDPNLDDYQRRLADLEAEVHQGRNARPEDPATPALR